MNFNLTIGQAIDAAIKGDRVYISETDFFFYKDGDFFDEGDHEFIIHDYLDHKFSLKPKPILSENWRDALLGFRHQIQPLSLHGTLNETILSIEAYEKVLKSIWTMTDRNTASMAAWEVLKKVRGEEWVSSLGAPEEGIRE